MFSKMIKKTASLSTKNLYNIYFYSTNIKYIFNKTKILPPGSRTGAKTESPTDWKQDIPAV